MRLQNNNSCMNIVVVVLGVLLENVQGSIYVDWSASRCVYNDLNKPWDPLYSSLEECCNKMLWWSENCIWFPLEQEKPTQQPTYKAVPRPTAPWLAPAVPPTNNDEPSPNPPSERTLRPTQTFMFSTQPTRTNGGSTQSTSSVKPTRSPRPTKKKQLQPAKTSRPTKKTPPAEPASNEYSSRTPRPTKKKHVPSPSSQKNTTPLPTRRNMFSKQPATQDEGSSPTPNPTRKKHHRPGKTRRPTKKAPPPKPQQIKTPRPTRRNIFSKQSIASYDGGSTATSRPTKKKHMLLSRPTKKTPRPKSPQMPIALPADSTRTPRPTKNKHKDVQPTKTLRPTKKVPTPKLQQKRTLRPTRRNIFSSKKPTKNELNRPTKTPRPTTKPPSKKHPKHSKCPTTKNKAVDMRPIADTYVSESYPLTNFGHRKALHVGSRGCTREALVTFDLSILNKKCIERAILSLYTLSETPRGVVVTAFVPTEEANLDGFDDWKESEATWNSTKKIKSKGMNTFSERLGSAKKYSWINVDVTAGAKTDSHITFWITAENHRAKFASKDSSKEHSPKLTFILC